MSVINGATRVRVVLEIRMNTLCSDYLCWKRDKGRSETVGEMKDDVQLDKNFGWRLSKFV